MSQGLGPREAQCTLELATRKFAHRPDVNRYLMRAAALNMRALTVDTERPALGHTNRGAVVRVDVHQGLLWIMFNQPPPLGLDR